MARFSTMSTIAISDTPFTRCSVEYTAFAPILPAPTKPILVMSVGRANGWMVKSVVPWHYPFACPRRWAPMAEPIRDLVDATLLFLQRGEEALSSGVPARALEACTELHNGICQTLAEQASAAHNALAGRSARE